MFYELIPSGFVLTSKQIPKSIIKFRSVSKCTSIKRHDLFEQLFYKPC